MGRLGSYDSSRLQVFLNELLAGPERGGIKWVDFGNVGGKCWLEVNGDVVVAWHGLLAFREYIGEVGAPVRYGCFCGNILLGNLSGDGDLVN